MTKDKSEKVMTQAYKAEEYMKAKRAAINFSEWLIENGYLTTDEVKEDINDIIEDFVVLKDKAPKLFYLLKNITDK